MKQLEQFQHDNKKRWRFTTPKELFVSCLVPHFQTIAETTSGS